MTRKSEDLMRSFWDAKARENAMYYVSSYRPYDEQDPDEFWRWGRILAERFLAESGIPFTGNESMLEIGCGIGRMTAFFAEQFHHVTGLDISEEMISRAGRNLQRFGNVDLVAGSGSDLGGLPDASFDFVFSYIVFQHIPDPKVTFDYIREMGRVLRPGGHAYFQVNNQSRTLRERLRFRSRLRRLLRRTARSAHAHNAPDAADANPGPTNLDSPAWQGSRVTIPQIEQACRQSDMHVVALRGEGTQYLWVKARRALDP